MGRPPCCDKVGVKKGPWTPEEDIILVSYIQEHGPGNWRSVPTNTGLLRCSKSCRLRWTNYLRPGIKRGNFTPHEEGMIIHLQALLGNKWAAIASYLPQRTDNDIKNYWNTHLKKKLKKLHSDSTITQQFASKSFNITNYNQNTSSSSLVDNNNNNNTILINNNNNNNNNGHISSTSSSLSSSSPASTTYASSTENISRLLEGWMKSSSLSLSCTKNNDNNLDNSKKGDEEHPRHQQGGGGGGEMMMMISNEEYESVLSFDTLNNIGSCWTDKSSNDEPDEKKQRSSSSENPNNNPPMSFLEKWLLDETTAGQVEEIMQLSPMF